MGIAVGVADPRRGVAMPVVLARVGVGTCLAVVVLYVGTKMCMRRNKTSYVVHAAGRGHRRGRAFWD